MIGTGCRVGSDFTVYQGVTLGDKLGRDTGKQPVIGDRVIVSAGAQVLGPVTIGSETRDRGELRGARLGPQPLRGGGSARQGQDREPLGSGVRRVLGGDQGVAEEPRLLSSAPTLYSMSALARPRARASQ